MCIVSMVMDHFEPLIPKTEPGTSVGPGFLNPWTQTPMYPGAIVIPQELADVRQLIADFREAVEAARKIDKITKQPDCEDPEKIKLVQRVQELETRVSFLEAFHQKQAIKKLRKKARKVPKKEKRL